MVPCPRPLTAGRVACAHAQLNHVTVAFWMYISSVATRDYITDDRRKLNYVTVTFWKYHQWLCETTSQTELQISSVALQDYIATELRNCRCTSAKKLKNPCALCDFSSFLGPETGY